MEYFTTDGLHVIVEGDKAKFNQVVFYKQPIAANYIHGKI